MSSGQNANYISIGQGVKLRETDLFKVGGTSPIPEDIACMTSAYLLEALEIKI